MVRFPTSHRLEREKARSHLIIHSRHPYPLHAICYTPCSPDIHFLITWVPDKLFSLCGHFFCWHCLIIY